MKAKRNVHVPGYGHLDVMQRFRHFFVKRISMACVLCNEVVLDYAADDKTMAKFGHYHRTCKAIWEHCQERHPEEFRSTEDHAAKVVAFIESIAKSRRHPS